MEKNATETYGIVQTAFRPSCMNRALVFEWHKRFKDDTESLRDDEKCGRSKEVNTLELIGQRVSVRVRVTMLRFVRSSGRDSVGRGQHFKSRQWYFHQNNAPVHNHIFVTEYLTKMGIKTLPQPPNSTELAPVTFAYSLSSEAVVMRQLRRWKRLWRRSFTRSHKRTSMGSSRSSWNGTTNALHPEEFSSKETRVSCVYSQ